MNHYQFQVSTCTLALTWNSQGQISRLDLYDNRCASPIADSAPPQAVADWVKRLRDFFDRGIPVGEFDWESIDRSGWTPFQEEVYRAITAIPHGETRTYGWVASRIGKFNATRAVGQALRNNRLPIIIPCHRVISVSSLGGFLGVQDPQESELRLKQNLISLETEYLNPVFSFFSAEECGEPAR